MRKAFLLVPIAVLVSAGFGWAAGAKTASRAAAAAKPSTPRWMQDLDRNVVLAKGVEGKTGTDEQYAEIQALADRGLKEARDLVVKDPSNAESQYMLGSWLIYGYHVVTTEQITTDSSGGRQTATVRQVVMGLSDNPQDGLDALRKAMELAPEKAQSALDYAAALVDTGRPEQAVGVLEAAWQGKPKLTTEEKMRAGLMLSDAYAAQDRTDDARHWLYSTLLLNPENAEIVKRLQELDVMPSVQPLPPAQPLPPMPATAPEAGPAPEEEAPSAEEEVAPESQPAPGEEVAPDTGQGGGDQAAPETQPAPGEEVAPDTGQGGGDQAAPEEPEAASPDEGGADQNGVDQGTDENTLMQMLGEEAGA